MRYLIAIILICSSCTTVRYYDDADTLTTGIVQREIHLGMSGADVAAVLGSPNIVQLDENRNEVWIYDKISSQVERCGSRSGVWLVIAGSGSAHCMSRTTQKTLTVIIKFDENCLVKDFTYHSSKF